MGWFDHDDSDQRDAYNQVQNAPHEASLSHELIGGAAAFEAMRAYQNHQEANGKPQSYEIAKDLIAGFAGAEVDRLVETKGLNEFDAERAKWEAREQSQKALAQSGQFGRQDYQRREYGGGGGGGYGNDQGYGGRDQGGYGGGGGGYGGRDQGGYGGGGGGYDRQQQNNW
ncbi:hypothetical protein CspeluHIS016_0308440 [Cutaneotrichosporon spelunceum]|uniref:Uncharacterized protein n=1 Tax=Cutaneotrichosporon spelunceum TaxID=1672016 RepID=A0AAD3TV15_9TREE|nr:hypothetical protein CspeluHIS016_0308440 [Cutaneotrichosporon spelunceum]